MACGALSVLLPTHSLPARVLLFCKDGSNSLPYVKLADHFQSCNGKKTGVNCYGDFAGSGQWESCVTIKKPLVRYQHAERRICAPIQFFGGICVGFYCMYFVFTNLSERRHKTIRFGKHIMGLAKEKIQKSANSLHENVAGKRSVNSNVGTVPALFYTLQFVSNGPNSFRDEAAKEEHMLHMQNNNADLYETGTVDETSHFQSHHISGSSEVHCSDLRKGLCRKYCTCSDWGS